MPRRTSEARQVADVLHSAAIHLLRGVRREDEASGLGPARLSALSVLVFRGAMRLTALAGLEQVRPPTMTKIVDGLERRGLVRRKADRSDARAITIEATPRGRAVLEAARRRRVARLAHALEGLSESELGDLRRAASVLEVVSARLRR